MLIALLPRLRRVLLLRGPLAVSTGQAIDSDDPMASGITVGDGVTAGPGRESVATIEKPSLSDDPGPAANGSASQHPGSPAPARSGSRGLRQKRGGERATWPGERADGGLPSKPTKRPSSLNVARFAYLWMYRPISIS
ncbi:hypothetical protein GGS23DRAFT_113287 [Durotheca rogersii]|uniref:uncharacterized protein n=1 Tax=Durotheca rogersii TaxID=419775 RepID=UPI0022202816|nr:uncharacterized protein GGS23DRAFT_113287 [Durotheca rogersii]KAI5862236.1 hypothetical protein GGS23DRAFT_113287 [Durotheca rogersii]